MKLGETGASTRKDEDGQRGVTVPPQATACSPVSPGRSCYACGRKTLRTNNLGATVSYSRHCGRVQPPEIGKGNQ